MSVLGLAFILKKGQPILSAVVIAGCFLYVGGAAENYSLVCITLLITWLLFLLKRAHFKVIALATSTPKKVLFGLLFLVISTTFTLTADGTQRRKEAIELSQNQYTDNVDKRASLLADQRTPLINVLVKRKYLVFLLLLIPVIFLGVCIKKTHQQVPAIFLRYNFKKLFFFSGILTLLIIAICLVPIFYIFESLGPLRTWASANFFIAVFGFFVSFSLGYYLLSDQNIARPVFYVSLIAGILIMFAYIIRQYPVVSVYAKAYDDRIEHLLELKKEGNTNAVILDQLPPSGMLVLGEIKGSESFYLQKILDLKFKIGIEEDQ